MRKGRKGTRFKAAKIVIKGDLGQRGQEIVKEVVEKEYRFPWMSMIIATLCMLAGFILALVGTDPSNGSFRLDVSNLLSFHGGIGGLLLVVGLLIVWFKRPVVNITIENNGEGENGE